MTLADINHKFKYTPDKSLDSWTGLQYNGEYLYGDCKYYCIFLKHNIEEFEDWDYYYCKLNGEGHCVLFKNSAVIDCNTKKVISFEQYCKMYKITEFKKYNWFVVLSKILFSKAYVWICSLKN